MSSRASTRWFPASTTVIAVPWGGTAHPIWFRNDPRVNSSIRLGRKHVVIHGNQNDKQTGMLQAYPGYHLVQQPPRQVGFASGCQAFGHRELLGQLRTFGLVMNPIVTEHS